MNPPEPGVSAVLLPFHRRVGFDGTVVGENSFIEKSWHWWLSRVVIPILVAAVALAGLLWVNQEDGGDLASDSASSTRTACADRTEDLNAGWGPDRPTIRSSEVFPQPSLNGQRDNPNYGDERNFLLVKEASSSSAGDWVDALDVVPGGEYLLRAYIHNGSADTPENIAGNTSLRLDIPTCEGRAVGLQVKIKSPSSYPITIWDTAIFRAAENFKIQLVPGSARQFSNQHPEGVPLPDRIAASGALVGSIAADGDIKGGYKNAIIVSARVRIL